MFFLCLMVTGVNHNRKQASNVWVGSGTIFSHPRISKHGVHFSPDAFSESGIPSHTVLFLCANGCFLTFLIIKHEEKTRFRVVGKQIFLPQIISLEGKAKKYLLNNAVNFVKLPEKAISLEYLYYETCFYFPKIICRWVFESK